MKKLVFLTVSCFLAIAACNKQAGNQGNNSDDPVQVSVISTSENMQVSLTSFTSAEVLDVHYTQNADSIAWSVSDPTSDNLDSAGYPRDTTWMPPYIPPPDSTVYPPDTSWTPPNIPPIDSAGYPRDTTWKPPYIPPPDSTIYPPDTTHTTPIPPPPDSNRVYDLPANRALTRAGYGYTSSINKDHLKIEIKNRGNYQVNAAAYRHNTNGSYSLLKTGFIRLSAK